MGIKKEDVEYVAYLSRLKISEDQIMLFTRQLSDIISYMDKLKELDTKDVPPTSHPLSIKNVFRKDEVKASLDSKDVVEPAPQKKGDFFKVPRVIEEV